jgi:psiF repeat
MRKLLIIGSLIAPLALGTGFAQTPSAPSKSDSTTSTATKPRSATSLECSKRADAKNLHGKERRKFRADCKKELSKKG